MDAVEWTKISFPSLPNDLFRAKISCSRDGKLLWLESKRTKAQWSITISDIADHSPKGILLPEDIVLSFLQNAFDEAEFSETADFKTKKNISVDLEIEKDGVILKLSIDLNAILKADFLFKLHPLELKPTEILEAQLRDVHDEILHLKDECHETNSEVSDSIFQLKEQLQNIPFFVNVHCQTITANSPVIWTNAEGPGTSLIKPCGGLNQITIDADGWYHLTAYGTPPTAAGHFFLLNVSRMTAMTFLANISLNLSLKKGDQLSIKAHAYSTTGHYCQLTLSKLRDFPSRDYVK